MNPTLEFQRYECKYLIREATALEVLRYASSYIKPDEHAQRSPDHTYSISSLYLDAPQLRLHHETQAGQKSRFKLRVRSYTDDPADPVFFEIKRRHNAVITKSRTMLTRGQMVKFFAGTLAIERLSERDRACIGEFSGRMLELAAEPKVIVRYRRQAYVGALDPGVRVTFDRQICGAPSEDAVVRHGGDGWTTVEDRRVVLELKFKGVMPGWMQDMLRRFELDRISYSKYSNSIMACGLDRARRLVPTKTV